MSVVNVGEVLNTGIPVPVFVVNAASRFAPDGVARNVATFAASPETPVAMGSPVALVSVADVGVPRMGETRVGEVLNTANPVPVSSLSTPASCAEVVAANWASVPITVE